MPEVGDTVPWFMARSHLTNQFRSDSLGGNWHVLVFVPEFGGPEGPVRRMLPALQDLAERIGLRTFPVFVVSTSAADEASADFRDGFWHGRVFWDGEGVLTRTWLGEGDRRPVAFLIAPRMTVHAVLSPDDPADLPAALSRAIDARPAAPAAQSIAMQAPVLIRPGVFEPELCRRLIELFDGSESRTGTVMVNAGATTREVVVRRHKVRRDVHVEEEGLRALIRERFATRLMPEIRRAFQFKATRIERYMLASYDAEDGGHFGRHRDDTTAGTAHRRFAVSVNLNDDYRGGELTFPEFGPAMYRPSAGGAVVFSCALMHEATPVTDGRRLVLVPFLFDEAGEELRRRNAERIRAAE